MYGVWVFTGAMARHKRTNFIRAKAKAFTNLVIHGANALLENPTPPSFLVVGGDRRGMKMINRERQRFVVVVNGLDPDHQPLGTIFIF